MSLSPLSTGGQHIRRVSKKLTCEILPIHTTSGLYIDLTTWQLKCKIVRLLVFSGDYLLCAGSGNATTFIQAQFVALYVSLTRNILHCIYFHNFIYWLIYITCCTSAKGKHWIEDPVTGQDERGLGPVWEIYIGMKNITILRRKKKLKVI